MLGDFFALHLELNPEIAIDRLLHRRVDAVTGEVFPRDFPLEYNPTTKNPLVIRKDDNPESIKNRIEYSLEETIPIIKEWEKDGIKVYHVDVTQSIDAVFTNLKTFLLSLS